MALKREAFGDVHSKEFELGDIVEWTTWNSELEIWKQNYGVLTHIQNEFRSNRLVSISKVMPLHTGSGELEFFTMSLRRVSRSDDLQIDT